ncbi:MAG: non-heme iron oxygenase ferredoxin subunit [Paracoccaceae bacterium]
MSAKPWQDVIALDDLEEKWVTRVALGQRLIAIYDTPSGIFASLALCNHGGADLCDGYFDGHVIECPLHQGAFDVRNGLPVAAPATRKMRVFETRVEGGVVQLRI